jgi:hypothetical protein
MTEPASPSFDPSKLANDTIETLDEFVHGVANREQVWFEANVETWSAEILL